MIYDLPICNFLGQPFQWLREISNMETEDAETTACVYSARSPALAPAPLTLIQTRAATLDDDLDECASPVCFYRSLRAHARSAGLGESAADAVTHG